MADSIKAVEQMLATIDQVKADQRDRTVLMAACLAFYQPAASASAAAHVAALTSASNLFATLWPVISPLAGPNH